MSYVVHTEQRITQKGILTGKVRTAKSSFGNIRDVHKYIHKYMRDRKALHLFDCKPF